MKSVQTSYRSTGPTVTVLGSLAERRKVLDYHWGMRRARPSRLAASSLVCLVDQRLP